ncbi:MAG: hypothetical protein R3E64_12980 [Halioglobus sp.]
MSKVIKRILMVMAFAWAGCAAAGSITDTVTVDGTEWAQVDLFVGLNWSDINVVCPAGVCGSGTLNGFEMEGWTWASIDDMNELFNYYIGFVALGPGPDVYTDAVDAFAPAFFADGWRLTSVVLSASKVTEGYNAGSTQNLASMTAFRDAQGICNFVICGGLTDFDSAVTGKDEGILFGDGPGAWFVRRSTEVPSPAMLPLFVLALAVLGFSRRKGKLQG